MCQWRPSLPKDISTPQCCSPCGVIYKSIDQPCEICPFRMRWDLLKELVEQRHSRWGFSFNSWPRNDISSKALWKGPGQGQGRIWAKAAQSLWDGKFVQLFTSPEKNILIQEKSQEIFLEGWQELWQKDLQESFVQIIDTCYKFQIRLFWEVAPSSASSSTVNLASSWNSVGRHLQKIKSKNPMDWLDSSTKSKLFEMVNP